MFQSIDVAARGVILCALLAGGLAWAPAAAGDPPGRVGRVGHSEGAVAYSPFGEDDWLEVERNRPLVRGDRLWSDGGGRAEIQVGSAVLRIAPRTSVELLDLDDEVAQFELTQGSVELRVPRVEGRQSYEIATPLLALVIERAGRYRVDVDPRRDETTVTIHEGRAEAYGEDSRFSLRAGDSVRFSGTDLRRHQVLGLPRGDDFDDYCLARERRLRDSRSLRYVDDDLVGYADLDDYGRWVDDREYGGVWYPRDIGADWAPYRDGHWVWQQPWGWTWVDHAPWGFAPLHYGRWARIGGRWGWIPGPRRTSAVFAPALVAFVGGGDWSVSLSLGGGSAVGWFPLGPREAWVPTYRASRAYFERVNRHNTTVDDALIGTLFNRYDSGSGAIALPRYALREVPGAFTAVPGAVFTEARPVGGARLRLDRAAAVRGDVLRGPPLGPGARSARGQAASTRARPAAPILERLVYARHAPPARTFAAPVEGADAAIEARQASRAAAERDRRERANVRLLQAPESRPDARRNRLPDDAVTPHRARDVDPRAGRRDADRPLAAHARRAVAPRSGARGGRTAPARSPGRVGTRRRCRRAARSGAAVEARGGSAVAARRGGGRTATARSGPAVAARGRSAGAARGQSAGAARGRRAGAARGRTAVTARGGRACAARRGTAFAARGRSRCAGGRSPDRRGAGAGRARARAERPPGRRAAG